MGIGKTCGLVRFSNTRALQGNHARPRQGFSLIEVLLAMALFAVSMYLITQSFTNTFIALDTLQNNNDTESNARLVRQHVFTINERDKLEDGGEFPLPNGEKANWDIEITESNLVDLFRCELTITFKDSEPQTSEHWLLRPAWSEEAERKTLLEDKKQAYQNIYGSSF